METFALTFLIQESAKKLIALFGDRFALKLPKARDTLDHLIASHQALSQLSSLIDQMQLALGTYAPDGGEARPLERPSFSAPIDVYDLTREAREQLAKLSVSLDRLGPQLAIFEPKVAAAVQYAYGMDAVYVVEIEDGPPLENLAELQEAVSAARDALAGFTRANYSIKDVKN